MPFVPGHEVVGRTLDELPGLPRGSRVVIDPVLRCAAREVPACPACIAGQTSRCDHITTGRLSAGLQTGFCADTGGGWSHRMLAHASQLHPVPEALPDEIAVLVEPLACAIHAVRRVPINPGASVLVIDSDGTARALRRSTGALLVEPESGAAYLLGGIDVAFECTGAAAGLDTALRSLRAGGTVIASGMPSGGVDLTPLWYRELHLVGAYASAVGDEPDGGDFPEAIALAGSAPLDGYVDTKYPLERWRDALDHAAAAGRLGTVKVVFAPS
jgi:threonine dehydrogenase-like Zn-dependent dehydrogenase